MPDATPAQSIPVFCTDEDIAVRCGADIIALTPDYQQMARGTDGVFAANAPWTLTSASVDFLANGVSPNQVILLTEPRPLFKGTGHILAIDSVASHRVVLRRLHKGLNVGQAPAPAAGLVGVAFLVATLDPQIEEASFDIKRRFCIDENIAGRTSSWVYDLRDLRMATVLSVLFDRYTSETRTDKGDFPIKVARIQQQLDAVLARVQVRWGPNGNSSPPSTLMGCRLSR